MSRTQGNQTEPLLHLLACNLGVDGMFVFLRMVRPIDGAGHSGHPCGRLKLQ